MTLILRLLLCLVLVLNGTGSVVAAYGVMADGTAASVVATDEATIASSEQPCHGAMTPEPDSTATAQTDHGTPMPDHGGNDCCGLDACQCACAQHHACAAMPTLAFVAAFLPHASNHGRMNTAHATPALSSLIRPPIA